LATELIKETAMQPTTPVTDATADWQTPPDPPETADAVASEERPMRRRNWRAKVGAGLAATIVVGGGMAVAIGHSSGSGSTAPASATGPNGNGGPGFGTTGGPGGGMVTAYRLSGSVTAKTGSTVTIKSSSATKTYSVTASTRLTKNGSTVTLSAFTVGESVFGSTTTSGGTTLNDLMAGTSGGPAGGPGPGGSSIGSGSVATGTTT
jgi:hypothetical protein